MVRTAVQKIADVLIFLCGFLIFCDILLLPLTPALAYFRFQNPASMRFDHLLAVFAYDFDDSFFPASLNALISAREAESSSIA